MRRPRPKTVSVIALGLAALTFAVAALTARGVPAAEVSLTDGGIWVTNRDLGVFGRFNRPIEELDALLSPGKAAQPDFDVLQEAGTVFLVDRDAGLLREMNVADIELGTEGLAMPADPQAALGGGIVALLERSTGKVWVRPAELIAGLDITKDEPTANVGGEAAVTVGRNGSVHAVSAVTDRLVSIHRDGSQDSRKLPVDIVEPSVTAVGEVAVVLSKGGKVVLPDEVASLPAPDAKLQQPGPGASSVLVATGRDLLSVDLSSGDIGKVSQGGTGDPAAPVRLGACVHMAWGGQPATYERRCDGAVPDKPVPLTDLGSSPALVFRVNRDLVVLNDAVSGAVFLFERGGENLGKWEKLIAQVTPPQDTKNNNPQRDPSKNTPPKAEDDKLGARPGLAAVLHVLDNDSDPDRDILVISSFTAVKPPGAGKLSIIHNGQALQFIANPGDNRTTVTFKYTIDDGRGGKASAGVTVTVRPDGNELPEQRMPIPQQTVEQSGTLTLNVLRDWRDPDGDLLLLVAASTPAPDAVHFTPGGQLTFTAAPNSPAGAKVVTFQVSDGQATKDGKFTVMVVARDSDIPPKVEDDLVSAVAGSTVTIRPLDNDVDPNTTVPGGDERLRLSFVSAAQTGTMVTPDYVAGTIAFTAAKPNTYYLSYRVTDGRSEATARIRVDVRAATSAHAPVAVADQVVVRGSKASVVDVLGNDVDLDGDVLVVRSIKVPENAGLLVSVIEHRWLRVSTTESGAGSSRSAIEYVVSDGAKSDTGVVTVTRLEPSQVNQPPIAMPDVATVRAGDVVSIDVLGNDSDPDGSAVTLDSRIVPDDDGRGDWMVTGGVVRFRATAQPGTATASYTVRDDRGTSAVGAVTVTVIGADRVNQIPQPAPISARAFAGVTVRIPIPLTGVDPDGDSVLLLGPVQAPKLGRIVKQGVDFLDYEAYATAGGTDVFTYRVIDAFGGRGTGTVRVGVVPFPEHNSAPVAVDDTLTVAPGVTVRVPVLANDSDVDADPLRLEALEPLNPNLPAGASAAGDRVVLTAPGKSGEQVTVRYGVSDGRGRRATASVTLVARDGANLAPIARDDLADQPPPGTKTIAVEVLANDDDLDGPKSELKLEVLGGKGDGQATVTGTGGLSIPLTATPRQIAYQITDRHGAKAVAFVRVPGNGNQPPRLRDSAPELVMPSGGELTVDIAALVADPEGAPVRLTTTAAISASPPAGLSVVPGESTPGTFKLLAGNGFRGLAAVVFEVTDETSPVSLSVPVTVIPPAGEPPVFACPPAEPVAGAPAVTVDLARCVRDGGEGASFKDLGAAPAGVTATLRGGVLEIAAAPDAQVGERGELTFTVTDKRGVAAGAKLKLFVLPSGLAMAVTDTIDGAKAGSTVRINVIANDLNPFPATPLKVQRVDLVSGEVTKAEVDPDKAHVVVSLPAGKFGRVTLSYRVSDATGKTDREVTGQIVVSVIDRPAPPGAPVARSAGDRFAVLAWSEPDPHGAPIEKYVVSGDHGFSQECAATVCKLEGLANGKVYTFQVVAVNAAGESDPSERSAEVRPDAKPGQPPPPATQFGDASITVTWSRPGTNGGSAIRDYEVEISPPAGSPKTVSGTTVTWTGLTNGAAYTFRARARNSTLAGEWSGYSAPEIPAKAPNMPAAPAAAGVADGIGQQIRVDWTEPATNGAPVIQYQLTVIRAGVIERTINVNGDTTQATVSVDNGVDYRFRVVATNKAGPSAQSPPSAVTIAHGRPFPVTAHSYSDNNAGTGYDGRAAYTLTAPNDNGMAISRYEFDHDGNGSADSSGGGTSGFVTGLSNGGTYQIRVRACNDMCGNWSGAGNSVIPYGPVPRPNAGAAKLGATQVRLSWSSSGTNGRPLNRLEIRVNGGGWENVGTSAGSRDVGNGHNQTHSIEVRAIDSAGQTSPSAAASATTDAPAALVTVYKGGNAAGQPGCVTSGCRYVGVQLDNFPANWSGTCRITATTGWDVAASPSVNANGSGYFRGQFYQYYGYTGETLTVTCNGVSGSLTW